MKVLSLAKFKTRFSLNQSDVTMLSKNRIIQIQQNGYLGDSKAHHKLVIFDERFKIATKFTKATDERDFRRWFNRLPQSQRRLLTFWLINIKTGAGYRYGRKTRKITGLRPPYVSCKQLTSMPEVLQEAPIAV